MVMKSATHKVVTPYVTEAEGTSGVATAQDIIYTCRTLTSVGLSVELPIVLEMENQGAVDDLFSCVNVLCTLYLESQILRIST